MKRTIIIPLIGLLVLLCSCSSGEWEWHATEYMVGDWDIIEMQTEDGEIFWEEENWEEDGFYMDHITIGEDGSYLETKTNGTDTNIVEGTWESEEDQEVSRILVTLNDGREFEIAWTNSTDPYTIRYMDEDYIYVFAQSE